MKIEEPSKYNFCNICHVYGEAQMIEVEITLVEETPQVMFCTECIENLAKLASTIKRNKE